MVESKEKTKPAEAVKIMTVEQLQEAYPELVQQIINASETAQILTVQDLQEAYPELVRQIKDETVEFINNRTIPQIKKVMPDLYQRIATDITSKSGPDLNVKGFLLEIADPYAAGTLRTYQNLTQVDGLKLPYVLPYKDKHTKAAIKNYILRADGGGDTKRVEPARKAMAKCK